MRNWEQDLYEAFGITEGANTFRVIKMAWGANKGSDVKTGLSTVAAAEKIAHKKATQDHKNSYIVATDVDEFGRYSFNITYRYNSKKGQLEKRPGAPFDPTGLTKVVEGSADNTGGLREEECPDCESMDCECSVEEARLSEGKKNAPKSAKVFKDRDGQWKPKFDKEVYINFQGKSKDELVGRLKNFYPDIEIKEAESLQEADKKQTAKDVEKVARAIGIKGKAKTQSTTSVYPEERVSWSDNFDSEEEFRKLFQDIRKKVKGLGWTRQGYISGSMKKGYLLGSFSSDDKGRLAIKIHWNTSSNRMNGFVTGYVVGPNEAIEEKGLPKGEYWAKEGKTPWGAKAKKKKSLAPKHSQKDYDKLVGAAQASSVLGSPDALKGMSADKMKKVIRKALKKKNESWQDKFRNTLLEERDMTKSESLEQDFSIIRGQIHRTSARVKEQYSLGGGAQGLKIVKGSADKVAKMLSKEKEWKGKYKFSAKKDMLVISKSLTEGAHPDKGFTILDKRTNKPVTGVWHKVADADKALKDGKDFDHKTHQVVDVKYMNQSAFESTVTEADTIVTFSAKVDASKAARVIGKKFKKQLGDVKADGLYGTNGKVMSDYVIDPTLKGKMADWAHSSAGRKAMNETTFESTVTEAKLSSEAKLSNSVRALHPEHLGDVMGASLKDQARRHLKKVGWSAKKIADLEAGMLKKSPYGIGIEESTWTESFKQDIQEAMEPKVIQQLRKIVKTKSMGKAGGMTVDLTSANVTLQVYDALNPANKAKMEKLPIRKMIDVAFKVGSRSRR